jgi:DNA modification methylase
VHEFVDDNTHAVRTDWTLHVGDCLEGMKTLAAGSVDVVITDPPYDEHTHGAVRSSRMNSDARAGGKEKPDAKTLAASRRCVDLGFEALTPEEMKGAAEHFARLARRWVLVFCTIEMAPDWRNELRAAGLEYIRTGLWRRLCGAPQFTGDRPGTGAEAIVIAHAQRDLKPVKKRWNGGGHHAWWDTREVVEAPVWEHAIVLNRGGGSSRVHPTQKPLDLLLELVELFTDPGELVLDAYSGSGTTGVACRKLGRRFVGWELSADHAAIARARIAGEARATAVGQLALGLGGA